MKFAKRYARGVLAAATLTFALPFASAGFAAEFTGTWSGILEAGGQKLILVFNIQGEPGSYSATMDVPAQGAEGIPVDSLQIQGRKIMLSVAAAGMSYSGELTEDGQSIAGTYSQAGMDIALDLQSGAVDTAAFAQNRPQTPKEPFPYGSEEVRYPNAKAEGVTLAGTLLIPDGSGPFPAVIFITGSGPQDRNESMAGHKPFLVIADYLTRRGIATLRFDDRGTAESTGDHGAATSFDFADDVLAGVEFLKTRPEIDSREIGLIGHSEGGLIAPIAATKSKDVAYLVLLAGPAIPGELLILQQLADVLRSVGVAEDTIARNTEIDRQLYAIMAAEPDEEKAAAQMREVLEARPESDRQIPMLKTESIISSRNNAWWRTFLAYDPGPTLASLEVPVLALFCELDFNVLPSLNVPAIRAAFEQSGNPNARIIEFPGLNHIFQHTNGVPPTNYGEIEETFSPEVLEVIGDWIASMVNG